MEENKYLNEEKYQKTEKTITIIAVLVLIIGLCVGGFLIYKGVAKPEAEKLEELATKLETRRKELESNGVKFSQFAQYTDGDAYDLKIITKALDPSFNNCAFDEYKNNSLTKEYCALKNSSGSSARTALIMVGAVICMITFMVSGMIFMIAKRRKMLAFTVQQVMPVAKEGIDEISPTIGKAAEEITKGIRKR